MKKDLNIYLEMILESIELIESYANWFDLKDFKNDKKTSDACLMQFQHLWETASKVRKDYWNLWLPLDEMTWFRNFIAHEYLWIKIEIVWETIKFDLPDLKKKITKLKKIS